MHPDSAPQCAIDGLRELLSIVAIDAAPVLAILSLVQHEFASVLAKCGQDFLEARLHFANLFKLEIDHFGARISSRDINPAALRKQGIADSLATRFLSDNEADGFTSVMRIDWADAIALFNPRNQAVMLTAPDHWLLCTRLPEFFELAPDAPRAPVESPSFLRLLSAKDLRRNLVGDALLHLEVGAGAPRAELRELLIAASQLQTLVLRDSALLVCGSFDDLELPNLRRLDLLAASQLVESGWDRARRWRGLRRLKVDGVRLNHSNAGVLSAIGDTEFWTALEHLDLRVFPHHGVLPGSLWADLWADRRFDASFLRLRFLDPVMLGAVWQGNFSVLADLDISRNDLGDGVLRALENARLPALRAVDIRRNSILKSTLRTFAAQHGFPRLTRIAIDLSSDEIESYHDWNGALVGSGPVPLSAAAVQAEYLAPVGLCIFPGFDESA